MKLEDATALGLQIAGLIAEAGIEKANAHVDPIKAGNDLDGGRAVVIVRPSPITYDTYDQATVEWNVIVAAGPAGDYLAAWPRLDQLLEAIRVPLGIESAEPSSYRPQSGKEYPAYLVKLTMSYLPKE